MHFPRWLDRENQGFVALIGINFLVLSGQNYLFVFKFTLYITRISNLTSVRTYSARHSSRWTKGLLRFRKSKKSKVGASFWETWWSKIWFIQNLDMVVIRINIALKFAPHLCLCKLTRLTFSKPKVGQNSSQTETFWCK